MLRGIYSSASGMLTYMEQTATTANNLANVDTVGFKRDLLLFNSQPEVDIWRKDDPTHLGIDGRQLPKYMGKLSTGNTDTVIHRDHEKGSSVHTGNPLDVYLDGDGFLRLETPQGERYTRNGSLTRDAAGYLADRSGHRVLGFSGPIQIPDGNAEISRSGIVTVNGEAVGTLILAHFSDVQVLEKQGQNMWSNPGSEETVGNTEIVSGALEGSNVDTSRSIVELITQSRNFEMASKSLRTGDEVLNIIVNQLGRMPQ